MLGSSSYNRKEQFKRIKLGFYPSIIFKYPAVCNTESCKRLTIYECYYPTYLLMKTILLCYAIDETTVIGGRMYTIIVGFQLYKLLSCELIPNKNPLIIRTSDNPNFVWRNCTNSPNFIMPYRKNITMMPYVKSNRNKENYTFIASLPKE